MESLLENEIRKVEKIPPKINRIKDEEGYEYLRRVNIYLNSLSSVFPKYEETLR